MRRSVPLRRSLFVRLLTGSVLVAVCAISATTWLVMSTTTAAIRQEQGQSLTADARIYDALLAYAAVHRDWDGAGPTVRELAHRTARRIVLTTPRRELITASSASRAALPRQPWATVDPLDVDPALSSDRIDPRAVGPFRRSRRAARATPTPTPSVAAPAPQRSAPAPAPDLKLRKALARLTAQTNACLRRRHRSSIQLALDDAGAPTVPVAAGNRTIDTCLASARRAQLRRYVAPAALLFVSGPAGVAATSLDLSSRHRMRIVAVVLLVLAATVAATTLVARRFVRPLRVVTHAAERMEDGDLSVRVPIGGRDEIGVLAGAFNAMSERREQLERQRTAMVSDVAHELRTPVSNIRGWLEAAQDGLATPDPAFVSSLLEEATLLHHVIDDLQDLSAADAGELRVYPDRIRALDTLEQVAASHRLRAEQAGVTLAVSGDRDLELDADPIRLRQAIGNLVSNAVRHSPAGTAVTLRAAVDVERADTIALSVADEGEGIAPANLPHVFDRFWRAEKSRNRRAGGSGLGLAIVRKLAEAHGGTVTVTSAPGQGATFTLRLPRAR